LFFQKIRLTRAEQKERWKDAVTRTRYQAVRLYGEGYLEAEIEQTTGCSQTLSVITKKVSKAGIARPHSVKKTSGTVYIRYFQ
jgi:hypothetical protein